MDRLTARKQSWVAGAPPSDIRIIRLGPITGYSPDHHSREALPRLPPPQGPAEGEFTWHHRRKHEFILIGQ